MLSKLNVLQGGFENRFIPELSAETKSQIEVSYKITGDKELQSLSKKSTRDILHTSEDELLSNI